MFSVYAAHYYYCIVFVSYVVFLLNFDNPFSSVICPAADAGLLPFPIMKIWLGFHSQNSQYSIHTLSKAGSGWMRNGRNNNALEVELYLWKLGWMLNWREKGYYYFHSGRTKKKRDGSITTHKTKLACVVIRSLGCWCVLDVGRESSNRSTSETLLVRKHQNQTMHP